MEFRDARIQTDWYGNALYNASVESDRRIVQEVAAIAAERAVPMAQIALAWVAQKSAISSPILGASKPQQLADGIAALELTLNDSEISRLESPYVPRPVAGHD